VVKHVGIPQPATVTVYYHRYKATTASFCEQGDERSCLIGKDSYYVFQEDLLNFCFFDGNFGILFILFLIIL
jgi:hypothetical protein